MSTRRVFFNTGKPIFGDDARAWVASALDGAQPALVAQVMNYKSDVNTTKTAFPLVQFFGSKEGFGLLGFADGATAVDDITPILHAALSRQGHVVQINAITLENSIETRPYAIRYRVPRMVVQKKAVHLEWLKDPEKGKAHIERLFLDSIKRQAEAVGLEMPEGVTVDFMGASGTVGAKPKKDLSLALLALRNGQFDVNVRLGGMWSVGYHLSKGYGHFNAAQQLGGAYGDEVIHALSK